MGHIFQRAARLWRHRWAETDVQRLFPVQVLQRLESQVRASETRHTGQIRLCIEGGLPYSYIWRGACARDRAVGLFGKLRVWDTEHNNGILIYVLLADHAIEIVADRAVARCISQAQWDVLVGQMRQTFLSGHFAQGLESALQAATDILAQHFPRHQAAPHDAETGLPDAPVVQGRFFKDQ